MVDFKKDIWLYALLAAILALIGILVPWGSLDVGGGVTAYSWLGGSITYYADIPSPFPEWVGAGLSVWTLALVMMSIATLLLVSISTWKGKEWKWDWLFYILAGIVLLIFPILVLVLEGVEDAVPIGSIFIIIGGVIAIIGFIFDKFGDKIFGGGGGA